jgi:UDP-glucose 4-epimerase
MKILITGGAGFIGSHLAFSLEGLGNEITVLDNMTTGSSSNLQGFEGKLVPGDIRNSVLVEKLVMDSDCIIHMAASLGVQRIMESTLESMSVNILGSEVVLLASAKHGKRTLIASTSEIYGKNPKQPLAETDDRVIGSPQKIRWSYSDAKAIEEAMAQALFAEEKLPVTTVRFFNTVGPRQTGMYGMVIPKLVRSAVDGENLLVHGDGSQSRVFCHVLDAVDAVTKLLFSDDSIGEVYNIGGVEEVTIKELAERIVLRSGSKSKIEFVPHSSVYPVGFEDINRRVPDIGKIKRNFDWSPKLSLDQIIDDVIEDFRQNPNKN